MTEALGVVGRRGCSVARLDARAPSGVDRPSKPVRVARVPIYIQLERSEAPVSLLSFTLNHSRLP